MNADLITIDDLSPTTGRHRATPYLHDEDVLRMVNRLARGEITDQKAEAVARAVHLLAGWAGTPVKWDDEGQYWRSGSREAATADAREVLEEVKAKREGALTVIRLSHPNDTPEAVYDTLAAVTVAFSYWCDAHGVTTGAEPHIDRMARIVADVERQKLGGRS